MSSRDNKLSIPEDYTGLAVIGGSGAWGFSTGELGRKLEGFSDIHIETPFGEAAVIDFISPAEGAGCFAFISRHGRQGYRITASEVNYRANLWALKKAGTTRIFAWSGPGAVNTRFTPGDYILPDDLIDLTRNRESTFFKGTGLGFIRQNPVFCPRMRPLLAAAVTAAGFRAYDGGVYAVTEGPRLETSAEVRMISRLGGELVGMTLAPECFLARELEMCYHPLCYVTNWAEGVRELPYREGELFEGMLEPELKACVDVAVKGLASVARQAAIACSQPESENRDCPCSRSMMRYRSAGRISGYWEEWIHPE
jgi:5'-methylthioadenosine phosphorylase